MSQRQDMIDESEDLGLTLIDGMTARDSPRFFLPALQRTKTIKHDLDKHLLMLNVIPTTQKSELNKMVRK